MTALDDALAAVTRGEDAAIYAYGVLGPHLTGISLALAQQSETTHRDQRDALLETLSDPPTPEAVYAIPFPVTDAASAVRLAVYVEEHCAALWRAVVVASAAADRAARLGTLSDTANRAAAFRRAGGAIPGTVAFPGLSA